jgi:cyclopropane fatty-acyl-phospholipid synthase-like methyltransferase
MKAFTVTQKDLLELKYWLTCDIEEEEKKAQRYLSLFSNVKITLETNQILEIGTGPLWGMLPNYPMVQRRVAVDPLIELYYATGVLAERRDIQYYSEDFITWDSNDKFDAIFCINALDHGGMGFHLLPKIANLLRPGGLFFLHVHLRAPDELNLIHDHCLTEDQLKKNLKYTNFQQVAYRRIERDDEPPNCPAIAGVWRTSL